MRIRLNKFRNGIAASVLGVLCGFSGVSSAANLALSDAPLFILSSTEPNVYLLVDDSGSMEWEILLENDGAQDGLGVGIALARYVLPTANNGSDTDKPVQYYWTAPDDDTIPGMGLWRLKSAAQNRLYYNPNVSYQPWPNINGARDAAYPTGDPPFNAVPVDPIDSTLGTFDLTTNTGSFLNRRRDNDSDYFENVYPAKYYKWTDTNTTDPGLSGNGVVDATDTHVKVEIRPTVTSYTNDVGRDDCAASTTCTYDEEMRNFANWFQYYRKRSFVARAAIGVVVNGAENIRVGMHVYNATDPQLTPLSLSNAANKLSFLETLYQTPFPCTIGAGCPATPARQAFVDLGEFFKGPSSPILSEAAGGQCQQNFNILVTDGYWNGTLDASSEASIGNADADDLADNSDFDGPPYEDAFSVTLGDIAMHYYEHDLRADISNLVPGVNNLQHLVTYTVSFGATGSLDPFNTKTPGDLSDSVPTDPSFSWPEPVAGDRTTVDDLWHAAYNGRGSFFAAQNPNELANSLASVVENVVQRTSSTASSVALSAGEIRSGSLLFQATFNSNDWTGDVLARNLDLDGSVGGVAFSAACALTGGTCDADGETYTGQAWSARKILTFKPVTGVGSGFRWTNLEVGQQAALNLNVDTAAADTLGESRLEYLRGRDVAGMRQRNSLLGDIVDSNPVYVGAPPFGYQDSMEPVPYSQFVTSKTSRTPIVYVGANDGLLHGFNATTTAGSKGEEEIAYVPSSVYRNLSRLTSPNYGDLIPHRYFVNGSPTVGDVFFGGTWKTVLVGSLGNGGQGMYALDVTDPSSFSESAAGTTVLWEFTDTDRSSDSLVTGDSDLGYTYGQAAIVRMHNGKWVAIFGNGYNNTANAGGADTSVSSSGNAVLYIVDIANGDLIKKFDTGAGLDLTDTETFNDTPNGIATPSPVDVDGDRIVDYIFAPDLHGNVWKINVTGSTPSSWNFALGGGSTPDPLFTADAGGERQPITSRVSVGLHPTLPGYLVYIGTGKYVENGDSADTAVQSYYAIWDRNLTSASGITRDDLLQQTIDQESTVSGTAVRVTSDGPIVWFAGTGTPTDPATEGYLGWHLDFGTVGSSTPTPTGERVVTASLLRNGRIIFATLVPSNEACGSGGSSWLMELSAYDGSRLSEPPFDLNDDGMFTLADTLSGTNISGVNLGIGITGTPGVAIPGYGENASDPGGAGNADLQQRSREIKYLSGSAGAQLRTLSENRGAQNSGRQSWRQIWSD